MRKFSVVPGLFAGLVMLSAPAVSPAGVFLSIRVAPPVLEFLSSLRARPTDIFGSLATGVMAMQVITGYPACGSPLLRPASSGRLVIGVLPTDSTLLTLATGARP